MSCSVAFGCSAATAADSSPVASGDVISVSTTLSGVAAGERLTSRGLAGDRFFRSIIAAEGLEKPLAEMGLTIAETTIETFAGLPPGHPLFER